MLNHVPTTAFLMALTLAASSVDALAQEPSLPYTIVGTGQTTFYDNRGPISEPEPGTPFFGQDAQYRARQPAYKDNGDGTVTDQHTGLTWEKGVRRLDWVQAASEAAATNTGGYNDWRVPTVKELYSLILFTGNQGRARPDDPVAPPDARPFIDAGAFTFSYPQSGRYIDAQYITQTQYVARIMAGQECFFGVNFADGRIKCYPIAGHRNRQYFSRFVRGNPNYGRNDLTDNGDGTITDDATGLMWARIDSGDPDFAEAVSGTQKANGAMNWEEALRFASELDYAGHNDWRLPTAKQLHSIVDYSRAPDRTNSAAIDALFRTTTIVNEAGGEDFPSYWTSTTFEPGPDAVIFQFGRALGEFAPRGQALGFYDTHGAGSQRTDPKAGSPSSGSGPQGDVRRVYNYVRVVRTK